jgi:hypothetical protein
MCDKDSVSSCPLHCFSGERTVKILSNSFFFDGYNYDGFNSQFIRQNSSIWRIIYSGLMLVKEHNNMNLIKHVDDRQAS